MDELDPKETEMQQAKREQESFVDRAMRPVRARKTVLQAQVRRASIRDATAAQSPRILPTPRKTVTATPGSPRKSRRALALTVTTQARSSKQVHETC